MTSSLRARLSRIDAPVLALLGGAWLKHFYSHASAEELRFVLSPTAWLTQSLLHTEFAFRPAEGYLSREQSVLISPACAGVNFLIAAFLTLALGFAPRFAALGARLAWLVAALLAAFVTTLLVNTARIVLSIELAHLAVRCLGLTFQSIHRLLGIATYLAGLIGLCLTVSFWLRSREPHLMHLRALWVALACYVGVTLLVPLLRGAAHNPDYWSHAAPVSVLVGVVAALLFAARGRTWDDGRHAVCSSEHPERVASQQSTGC